MYKVYMTSKHNFNWHQHGSCWCQYQLCRN